MNAKIIVILHPREILGVEMAGHNKWSKIKHKKGAQDAKKSKVWTKIIRDITLASRLGGGDPDSNPRLRKSLDDAKSANMPKDNINRAIAKGIGGGGEELEELVYEGYAPGGVAVIVECMTDNRNRTLSEVRTAIQKKGGSLGTSGSVLFLFKKKGQIVFDAENGPLPSEDKLLEIGLDNGLEEIQKDLDSVVITCEPEDYLKLKDALTTHGLNPSSSEIAMIPDIYVKSAGENAKKIMDMIDVLEELDDVQNVYTNVDIDDDELARLTQ